jgi:raffinose/stachyose/melibiose transport system substrate-binding protein
MKKLTLITTALLATTVLVSACGNGEEAAPADKGTSGGKVKLTIWHNWSGQDAKAVAMRKILDDFQSQNKDIELEIEGLPTDGLKTRLNKALLDQYHVAVPKTWDELMAAVKTFNDNKIIPIALGNKANWAAQSTIFSGLADRMTGSDWFLKAAKQDGVKFTDPEFIQALKKLQELSNAKAFQDGFNSIDQNQMRQLFYQGKAAMFIDGGWAMADVVQNAPKDLLANTHIALMPSIAGGKGDPQSTSGVVGTGLGVSKKLTGAKKEAAQKLFYALSGPDGQQATLNSSTLVSYKIDLDPSKANPLFVELNDLMKTTKITPVYDAKLSSAAVEVINNGLQELLMGGSPEAIAKKIQDSQAASLGK